MARKFPPMYEHLRSFIAWHVALHVAPMDREDMIQDLVVWVWQKERKHPRQAIRWYQQGIKWRLVDMLRRGKCPLSVRHRHRVRTLPEAVAYSQHGDGYAEPYRDALMAAEDRAAEKSEAEAVATPLATRP